MVPCGSYTGIERAIVGASVPLVQGASRALGCVCSSNQDRRVSVPGEDCHARTSEDARAYIFLSGLLVGRAGGAHSSVAIGGAVGVVRILDGVHAAIGFRQQVLGVAAIGGIESLADAHRD